MVLIKIIRLSGIQMHAVPKVSYEDSEQNDKVGK